MNHLYADRIRVHTVVGCPIADRRRANLIVSAFILHAERRVMARIPKARMVGNFIQRNALDDRAVFVHDEMRRDTVSARIPPGDDGSPRPLILRYRAKQCISDTPQA